MANLPTTEFIKHETTIPGLLVFDVNFVSDDRGYFQEKYHKAKLAAAGLPTEFQVVQNSLSYNKEAGVTRGLHAEPWDKYISVIMGKVFAAYVDLRQGKTFGQTVTVEIDPNTTVFLPRGVANSFQTLEPNTYYLYSVNEHWCADNYEQYAFINLADQTLDIRWPIKLTEAIISDRDKNHPMLSDVAPVAIN